jgi:small subunit ribosomal protein S10
MMTRASTPKLIPRLVSKLGTFFAPKRTRRWCLLKSPHVNKKSREHFEATTYSRIIDVHIEIDKIDQYGKDLCKIGLPSGVRMELRNSIS